MAARPQAGIAGVATGVACLAALISFAWSWQPAYWHDEAATLSATDRSVGELWAMLENIGAFNTVYYLAMDGWIGAFGSNELATRSFSAIGLAACCFLLVLLGYRLGGRRLAITAGLIAAVLPGLSWSGAEARVYAWNAAIAVASTLMLFVASDSPRRRSWVGYVAVTAFMGYTFIFSLLMLPVHALTLLLLRRLTRQWWIAAAAVIAAVLPLLLFAGEERERADYESMGAVELVGKAALRQYFLSTRADDGLGIALISATLLFLVAVLLTTLAIGGRPQTWPVVATALPWALIPAVVLVGYSLVGSTVYQERYLTFCAPAVALLMAAGLLRLRVGSTMFAATSVLIVLLALPMLIQQKGVASRSQQDYRRLADYVEARADVAIFPKDSSRSLAEAYPERFTAVPELNLAATPLQAENYWGRTDPPGRVSLEGVAGNRVALVAFTRPTATDRAYRRLLAAMGCDRADSTGGARLTVHLYDCPEG